jgi:hypothetical protein
MLSKLPPNAVVKLKIIGKVCKNQMEALNAPTLRALAKPTMNINTSFINEALPTKKQKPISVHIEYDA